MVYPPLTVMTYPVTTLPTSARSLRRGQDPGALALEGVIVTGHGVAGLRGAPVTVRYERMLAIAHPGHRAALAAELEDNLMNGARA